MTTQQDHHPHLHEAHTQSKDRLIALAGNPNVGKSVFFAHFTGIYAEVSNYPGTTVETTSGESKLGTIVDTPGIYGVSSFNDEERVARDMILGADVVINIVNALHLERDLFLTLQLADMGIPMVVALNLIDEAEKEGLEIDADLLSDLLGVPVVPTVATKGIGMNDLIASIGSARPGIPDQGISDRVTELLRTVGTRGEAILVLEGDEVVSKRHGVPPGDMREEIYVRRRKRVNDIVGHVVKEVRTTRRLAVKLGELTLRPWSGILILACVLYGVYEAIGVLVAQKLVGFTEGTVMNGIWEPAVRSLVFRWMPATTVLGKILAGEFGLLTMTITYLIGLLLPLVLAFYLTLAILEDSGYLPRLATLTDRMLNVIGLNGRAVIPIILGFGCITMATVTTRILGTRRERTIAASVLNFAIPCSAQLGIAALLLGRVGGLYALAYILIIGTCLVLVGTILNRTLQGESSSLLIDLPPMRIPRLTNILRKSLTRTGAFMIEAIPWFFAGALIIAIMQVTGALTFVQHALLPLTVNWLKLPPQAANAFILGMVRRDFGAAGFAHMALTPAQTLVALVTITLFVPCVASVAILFKERGRREATLIWLGTWVTAFLVGGIVSKFVVR